MSVTHQTTTAQAPNPERNFSKRYMAYCTANNMMPSKQREADDLIYEGRGLTGYINWIEERWGEWCGKTSRDATASIDAQADKDFNAFIEMRAQELSDAAAKSANKNGRKAAWTEY